MKISKKIVSAILMSVALGVMVPCVVSAAPMVINDSTPNPITITGAGSMYDIAGGGFPDVGVQIMTNSSKDIQVTEAHLMTGYFSSYGGSLLENRYPGSVSKFSGEKIVLYTDNSAGASNAHAISNSGDLTFDNDVNIVTIGTPAGSSIVANNGGNLTFNKMLAFSSSDDAIFIDNLANMNINGESSIISSNFNNIVINNEGNLKISGNKPVLLAGVIQHNPGATTDITLHGTDGNYSAFDGTVKGSDNNFKLTLEENSSWVMNNQTEDVYGVNLNGGEIFLSHEPEWFSTFKDVKLVNFKSNGTGEIIITADLANDDSDQVKFTGTAPAKVNVFIWNKDDNGGVAIRPEDGHDAVFAITPTSTNINASLGFYNNGVLCTPVIETVTDGPEKYWHFIGWNATDTEQSLESLKQSNNADTVTLVMDTAINNRRLNDIRTDPSEVGVWIRGERGKSKIRNYGYNYSLMCGGYDWHINNNARSLFYGLGLTYSKNNCSDSVIGKAKGMGYNLYGSWLGKKHNDYVDVVVKYGKLDKNYNGLDKYGAVVSGDYEKDMLVIATKYGRRIFKDNGFYYEPQLGYIYGRIGSTDFYEDDITSKTRIHADSTNSHILSFDVQFGKKVKGVDYYTKLGYVYDLDGKITVTAPELQLTEKDDMGGGYARFVIGASRKVGKNNSFYIDVEKDFGSKVKKPYAIDLGYRHTF